MKRFKIPFLTLLSICALTLQAAASGTPVVITGEIEDALKEKIVKLIDHPDLTHLDGYKFQAEVEFIVTRQNEIVVLGVYTEDSFFDKYIKEKLNYRNVNLKGIQRMTPYRINVNFIKSLKEKMQE